MAAMEQLRSLNKLEEKLSQTKKNLSTLTAENSYLTKALLVKEKTNDDLIRRKEAELETLMTRLDSIEKENAFLRYKSQSLEKELVHLNEEMECHRFKNSENVMKIKKVRDSERENNMLRESLIRKEEEIFSLRRKMSCFMDRLSLASSRSWAASEHNEHRSIGASSEMSLMDDFVEMEKLAIVDIDSRFPSCYHDRIVRDEFRKHLGGDGPGTAFGLESVQTLMVEMEKMLLGFHSENEGLRNELSLIRSSEESHRSIASTLQDKVEMLRESKRTAEDQIENLEMVSVDLDTQLTVAKSERNDLLGMLSNSEGNENQEELLLSGMGINRESSKQLKELGPANEPPVVDKVMSITDARTSKQQRSSLRDQMTHEDNDNPRSPMRKEIISTTINENAPPVFSFPDGQEVPTTPEHTNARALVVAPGRRRGGWGFMRKLLVRRKKYGSKNIY